MAVFHYVCVSIYTHFIYLYTYIHVYLHICVCCCCCYLVSKLGLTLWEPMTIILFPCNFPGQNTGVSCHFFLQGISQPRNQTCNFWLAGEFFTTETPGKVPHICMLLLFFSHSVMYDSLWPNGLQHARLSCPPLSPGMYSNACPLSQWCYLTVSYSVTPFSIGFSLPRYQDLSQ